MQVAYAPHCSVCVQSLRSSPQHSCPGLVQDIVDAGHLISGGQYQVEVLINKYDAVGDISKLHLGHVMACLVSKEGLACTTQ